MKIAVVFLLVALSSYIDAAPTQPSGCLEQLLESNAPNLLQSVGDLLCNYQVAKQQANGALFINFLNEVNTLLGNIGCTITDILGTDVTINPSNAEEIADAVAAKLFQFVENVIAKVDDILKDIPIIGDIVGDQTLTGDVRHFACGVLVDILTFADKVMQIAAEIAGIFAKN
ncbi:uncharacterized protein LOC100493618 [Xenopus tropicalis]|uniref:Uncharacterized LOC116409722 n=1 Tax=Xenopus tropicalis TaxID=8364 RepID=A0A803JA41_XENTR|nr:uncharacterized protein LOC100493618 [Xenopus tropicalis]|eukprot:XP_002939850.1 PREDICTED: uncharacterized protein LOC100493618 [Xenopus tropicalis]